MGMVIQARGPGGDGEASPNVLKIFCFSEEKMLEMVGGVVLSSYICTPN